MKYHRDYNRTVARVKRELKKNARPQITFATANMKDYDIIYIGYVKPSQKPVP